MRRGAATLLYFLLQDCVKTLLGSLQYSILPGAKSDFLSEPFLGKSFRISAFAGGNIKQQQTRGGGGGEGNNYTVICGKLRRCTCAFLHES